MRPGPPPKPTYLKLVAGNPGGKRLNMNEPKPTRKLMNAPDFLCDDAKTEWRRVAPELFRLGLLTVLDRAVLAMYCQAWGHWLAAERALRAMAERDPAGRGLLVKTANGNAIQNPLVGIANTEARMMISCGTEFGMTPASRSRIGTPGNGDPANPFAYLGPH
jgi:P27 family predicted phage terminase small subunit